MPLTTSGKFAITASSDLGGLGSRNGSPTVYDWAIPGVTPVLLPWLIALGLLALKPNRCATAWLIWLPLGCVFALTAVPPTSLPGRTNFLLDVTVALAIGLSALWLLSGYFPRHHRFITFLSTLVVLASSAALAVVLRQGMSLLTVESLQISVTLAVGVLASAMALSLAGLVCRKGYRPLALYLWVCLSVAAGWLVIITPFFVFALVSSGGRVSWSQFFLPIIAVAAGHYALLLPFLILSSASPFFRERLKTLLHMVPEAPPVLTNAGPENQLGTDRQPQELS